MSTYGDDDDGGGTAVIASGDLIGRAVQKKGGSENLGVVINQVQP